MAGLDPAIHVFFVAAETHGSPGRADRCPVGPLGSTDV